MITKFNNFENKPDLRMIGEVVKCIKTIPKNFKEGNYYKVSGMYGDPQRAIEEFGINDYLPVECVSKIIILNDKNIKKEFLVNKKYYKTVGSTIYDLDFFEYFEIQEFEENRKKYNL